MSVNSHLNNTASSLIIAEGEINIIANHIEVLGRRITNHFNAGISRTVKEHFSFGSYTRKTLMPRRADNYSDVDYMVVFETTGYAPGTYLNWLKRFVESQYQTSEIYQSHPTIVLELSRIIIELVPATKSAFDTYQIPAPSSNYTSWLDTYPNKFNSQVTTKNTNEKSQIRPLIRLMKYWNAQNNYVYSSYQLEQMIVNHLFFSCQNLWDYFHSFVSGLLTFNYPAYSAYKIERINRLKNACVTAKQLENQGQITLAEAEIQKVIPAY